MTHKGTSALLLLILQLCLLPASILTVPTYGEYTNSVSLGNQVTVKYKIVGNEAFFLIEKSAAGHLVFGLGSGMSSADVLTISKNQATNALTLEDCSLGGYMLPICGESSQDWAFASGSA